MRAQRNVNLRIPPVVVDALDEEAKRVQGRQLYRYTRSDLVRDLVIEGLRARGALPQPDNAPTGGG